MPPSGVSTSDIRDTGFSPGKAVRKILVTTLWFGGLILVAVWAYAGGSWALGFAGGGLVGAVNLIFLTALVREVIRPGKRNAAAITALLAVKIPVVYGGLAGLLLWKAIPHLAVVAGFSLVLLVIVLKAAGRALLATGIFGRTGWG